MANNRPSQQYRASLSTMLKPPGYLYFSHQVNIGPGGFARTTGLFYGMITTNADRWAKRSE